MSNNLPVYALDAAEVVTRSSEVPDADFANGMNKGACIHGIGINTGSYDPKDTDWARIEDTAAHQTQHIGGSLFDINTVNGADINNEVAFVQADANTIDNAVMDIATGAINRTGGTVPANAWAWGEIPIV